MSFSSIKNKLSDLWPISILIGVIALWLVFY